MRIPRAALTERLKKELDATMGSIMTGANSTTGQPGGGRRSQEIVAAYYKARQVTIVGWCLYVFGGLFALFALLVARKEGVVSLPTIAVAAAWLTYFVGMIPLHFAMPSTKGYTPEELEAYKPEMQLSTPERALLDTLIVAYADGADPLLRSEVVPPLRSLCDEWTKLDTIEAGLSSGGPGETEIEGLRSRLAQTEDETAREALRGSLVLAESRAGAALSERGAHERIGAHREMIRQSALSIAETVRRSRTSPTPTLDLAGLRANVAAATRDVAALESAVQEIRAL